eukprot:CAMPEP_0183714514 /NCGR_PEP_ID=MMETSP0737-20130205/9010_1 /TAXON_ID=385413 /ORGANISM="Thalassiosira miniscula, Strain CCMP1093" /LENGTH=352 /DNA_ID=CAMNT_0025943449 /DNA_START=72 /DNA_END=1130 /DNA_ORIENTATION=+
MAPPSCNKGAPSSRVVLILTNICFVIAGILVMVYAVKLDNSGWLDVFKTDVPCIRTNLLAGMLALGCTAILIAGIGFAGTIWRKKGLLCCYSSVLLLALILTLIVMAGAFASMDLAKDLSAKPYPGADEPFIADSFNQVYCYAEAAYLCNTAPVNDVLNYIIPGQEVPDSIASIVAGYEGINDLCNSAQSQFLLTLVPHADVVCEACQKAEQYETYESVYSWVEGQCPLSETGIDVLAWCASFIFEGKVGNSYNGAPYGVCRSQFLEFWSTMSENIVIGMVAFLVFLFIVIISACTLSRRRRSNGVVGSKLPEAKGLEVARNESTDEKANFPSDEEQQMQQQQARSSSVAIY